MKKHFSVLNIARTIVPVVRPKLPDWLKFISGKYPSPAVEGKGEGKIIIKHYITIHE